MEWSIVSAYKHRTSTSQQIHFIYRCRGSERFYAGQLPSEYRGRPGYLPVLPFVTRHHSTSMTHCQPLLPFPRAAAKLRP